MIIVFTALLLWHTTSSLAFVSNRITSINLNVGTLFANPVTSGGSKYSADITEEDAFLWFDEAIIYVRGGSGGSGSNAYKFGKGRQHTAPIGGSGGDGGSVKLVADSSINTLLGFRGQSSFKATNGEDGDLEYANGLSGSDFMVTVPTGTIIRDNSTGTTIGELHENGQILEVAIGGKGGKGNSVLRTKGEKIVCTSPTGGDRRWLRLELKLVADVGLVGVPNAGKSSLLDAITNAKPKIASYPFTTIIPNLGVCQVSSSNDGKAEAMVIADIPGLIEGAHEGTGLGKRFLRHVERCSMILHIVNGDSEDPVQDYLTINEELRLFSTTLAMKPQVVVLNKVDLPHVEAKQEDIMRRLRAVMPHSRLLAISAAGRVGVDALVERTYKFLSKVKADELAMSPPILDSTGEESRLIV
jgi:GTP-binding protein